MSFRSPAPEEAGTFPFDIPALQGLERLSLESPVTCLVGENGTGKSTVLEALAIEARLPVVGSQEVDRDETLRDQRRLARAMRLSWRRRTHRGFFLRAEDFFGFSRRLRQTRDEMEERLREVDEAYQDRSELARTLARGPAAASLHAMESRYGAGPDARSHGEGFLALLRSRLVPDGLYLLDEPEAALSVQSQLGLVSMIREAVDQGGQFILATHSPVLTAIPGAGLLSFDARPVRAVPYDALESVTLLRAFLAAPERYLRHLWP